MPRLLLSSIPPYLHDSALYKSFNQNEIEGFIDIPDDCFKENDTIARGNFEEFTQLLRIIQFWGIDDIPSSVVYFCSHCRHGTRWMQETENILGYHSPIFLALKYMFSDSLDNSIVHVIHSNRRELLEYWYSTTPKHSTFGLSASNVAAKLGRLDVLIQLHERGFYWDRAACTVAAENGHIHCLAYLHQCGCKWDYTASTGAAAGGHLDCLRFMHEKGLSWGGTECSAAAMSGKLECLIYLHEHGCPWDDEVTLQAAKHGHVNCLVYALTNGCPVHSDACCAASALGKIECLDLLRLHGSPLTETTMTAAVKAGEVAFVEHLFENGCPVDTTATDEAARKHEDHLLRYLLSNGCPYSDNVLLIAAEVGSLACLKYLIEEQGLYMSEDGTLFDTVFWNRHRDCLRFLLDVGCPMNSYLPFDISDSLHAQCLRQGGEVDPLLVRETLDKQLLDCIKCIADTGHTVDLRHKDLRLYVAQMKLSECSDYLLEEAFAQEAEEFKKEKEYKYKYYKSKYDILEHIMEGSRSSQILSLFRKSQ